MTAPKLFISYSWSNQQHEEWVLQLAEELRSSGVDVILDKWDLKEGHDAFAFMEKMVTDPDVKKVAIISDKIYAEKADGRAGGVGTETQIISKEVYENTAQEKFVLVVREKDETGKPYLPTYYKGRIYIDLSEADSYSEQYERLLRWIYDQPLYVKPELGKKPAFLATEKMVTIGTSTSFRRCLDAIKSNRPVAIGALEEYSAILTENIENFRIVKFDGEFDEAVVESIEAFLPYRNELIQLLIASAQYTTRDSGVIEKIHRLFEQLLPYLDNPEGMTQWQDSDFDNFRFIVHELFLYALAIFVKYERFEMTQFLLGQQYYSPRRVQYGKDPMVSFTAFSRSVGSLERTNQRLKLNRLSVDADLLKKRCSRVGIDFRHMMQADFIAYMRAEIEYEREHARWFPETLVYLGHFQNAFEVFARSTSRNYFERIKGMLSVNSPQDLAPLLQLYQSKERPLPQWRYDSFEPVKLLGFENLASRD